MGGDLSIEIIISIVSMVCFSLGVYITRSYPSKKQHPEKISIVKKDKTIDFGLTGRETEVLNFLAQGCSNKEIAERLFVSENTVKTHVSNLLSKLNAKRRTQAITVAKAYDLIH